MPTDLHSCRATRDTAPAPRVERRGRRVLAGCGRAQLTGTRYGKGGANFDLLLKAFTGDHSPCHRIGKDIPLERPALSLVLCVQPAAIADVLRDHYAKDTRQPVRRQPCRTRRLPGVFVPFVRQVLAVGAGGWHRGQWGSYLHRFQLSHRTVWTTHNFRSFDEYPFSQTGPARWAKKGYTGGCTLKSYFCKYGAANGTRTRDPKIHNLVL